MIFTTESHKSYFLFRDIFFFAKTSFTKTNPEIINFDIEPYSKSLLGYLGLHEVLTIKACDVEHQVKTLKFFIKTLGLTDNEYRLLVQREELAFYRDVMPQLLKVCKTEDPWGPNCYLSKPDLIVLEDLKFSGFEMIREPLNEDQLKALIASVARFHASSILLERDMHKPLNKVFQGFFEEKIFVDDGGFKKGWLLAGIQVAVAIAENLNLDPKYIIKAYQMTIEKVKLVENERNVLGHRDLWCSNMMFSNDQKKCRLIDFQIVSYSHYAIDLVQLIYLNTTKISRIQLEKQMIEYYYKIHNECFWNNNFDDIFYLKDVFRDFEEKRICGLVTALQYFPIALLHEELTAEYTKEVEELEKFIHGGRKKFVLKAMQLDMYYCSMIEDVVRDTVEFMKNLEAS